MYIYNAITKTGLLIHLSMSEEHTFYILVFDIDNFKLTMKFFNNIETALAFIQELWLVACTGNDPVSLDYQSSALPLS